MSLRLIEVFVDQGHTDTIRAAAEQHEAIDCYEGAVAEDGRQTIRILVSPSRQQAILDSIQKILSGSEGWRVILLPVEAALPVPPSDEASLRVPASATATREELMSELRKGARLDQGYLVLVVLSTVVAAIGLLTGSVAVIIGAMVIAPLLGPNLAFAFATAIGSRDLMALSFRSAIVGLSIAILVSMVIGIFWSESLSGAELLARTVVGYEDVALALAAGAAAVLSLTTGVSATLVGVMVAVALLPPAATVGMLLGSANWYSAGGAAILLAVNVVCINLAAQLVFSIKRLGPRTLTDQKESRVLVARNIAICFITLTILSYLIYRRGQSVLFG